MDPHQIMQRTQKTLIGISCIAGGCAALVCLLSYGHRLPALGSLLESTAAAEEATVAETPGGAAQDPVLPTQPSINDKALINDLDITDQVPESDLAPKSRVTIPDGRPAWVEADFTNDAGQQPGASLHRVAVSSGPFKRPHDARRALDDELLQATHNYINDYLQSDAAATLVPVDIDAIRSHLVQPGNFYHEQIEIAGLGPMYQSHALLEFTPVFNQKLDERWRSIVVTGRVAKLGVIAASVLLALSVVFGYFKADTATRGYYTTRLQLGVAATLLALVAGGFVLLRYV